MKGHFDCALLTRAIRYAIKRVEAERALAEERRKSQENLAVYNRQLREKNIQLEDDLRMARRGAAGVPAAAERRFAAQGGERFAAFLQHVSAREQRGGRFFPHPAAVGDDGGGVHQRCDGARGARRAGHRARAGARGGDGHRRGKPGIFLSQINHALLSILRRTGTPLFVSAFYMFVDVAFSESAIAVAGHPRQLIARRGTGTVETLPANGRDHGPALGIFDGQRYEMFRAKLSPGDRVLLFTDGLFEVEGPGGELFDQDRLLEVVRDRLNLPAAELPGAIINDVKQYAGNGVFLDDVCLVIMDFDGKPDDGLDHEHLNHEHPNTRREHNHDGHPPPPSAPGGRRAGCASSGCRRRP